MVESSNQDLTRSSLNHTIDKRDLLISGIFLGIVLVGGGILLLLGQNENLYIGNETVLKIFLVITDVGSENINIAIFCFCYLAIDKQFGRRMLIYFGITSYFTSFFKWTFQDPRPPVNYVAEYGHTDSYGFPSGHTTNAVSVWGYSYLGTQDLKKPKKTIVQIICIALFLLVPYSRMVIGVHDVNDIMGGYTLGIVCTVLCMIIGPKIYPKIQKWNMWVRIVVIMVIPTVAWLLGSWFLATLHPEDATRQIEDLALISGMLMGCGLGVPLEEKYVDYHPEYLSLKWKLIVGVIGLIITFGTYFALSAIFSFFPDEIYAYTRFVRYGLLTAVVTVLAPMLLKKISKQK